MTMIWCRTALGLAALIFAATALAQAPVERPLWQWSVAGSMGDSPYRVAIRQPVHPDAGVIWHAVPSTGAAPRVVTLDLDGTEVARFDLCEACIALTPIANGQAWVVESRGTGYPDPWDPRWAIHRLAASGELLQSIDFSHIAAVMQVALLPDADGLDVVLLPLSFEPGPGSGTLRVLRLDLAGNVVASGDYALDRILGSVVLTDWRRTSDGHLHLLLLLEDGMICLPGMPCPRSASAVLRLGADRAEVQRTDIEYALSWGVEHGIDERLDAEGRAWRLFYAIGAGPSLELMSNGAGSVAPIELPEGSSRIVRALGLVGYAILLDTNKGLQLAGPDGQLLAHRPAAMEFEWESLGADSDWGYLMFRPWNEPSYDAILLHPQTLDDRVRFDLDGAADARIEHHWPWGGWSVLPDGRVYASISANVDGVPHRVLAAFVVPGSPADRVFASGFE